MIKFEIVKSPDSEVLGVHETYRNEMIIGHCTVSDFPIFDPDISDIHCILCLTPQKLFIKSSDRTGSYLVNGKKYIGQKMIQSKDLIQIGTTDFIIIDFSYEQSSSLGEFKNYYKNTMKSYPETGLALEAIEREIIYLDKYREHFDENMDLPNQSDET